MPNRTVAHVVLVSAALLIGGVAPLVVRVPAASAARQQQPATPIVAATAPARPTQGIVGTLPSCDSTASISASTVDVRAGDIVTITARNRVICPQLLRSRGALFVVGGVPAWAEWSVRNGLAQIVDALGSAGGGRIARLAVGDDAPAPVWAVTDVEHAAVANALRTVDARRGGTAEEWSAALATADGMFRALPPAFRPMLIVVDGLPPAADRDRIDDALTAAIERCADGVGHSVLIDVSDSGWLVALPLDKPALGSKSIVVRASEHAVTSVSVEVAAVMATFHGPLREWFGTLLTNEAALVAIAAQPAVSLRSALLEWRMPAQGHEATFVVQATYRALDGSPLGEIEFRPTPLRRGVASFGTSVSLLLCIQPPPPRHIVCPGGARSTPTPVDFDSPTPSPTPSHTPTPSRTPSPTATPSPGPSTSPRATATDSRAPTSPPPARWRALIPIASRG